MIQPDLTGERFIADLRNAIEQEVKGEINRYISQQFVIERIVATVALRVMHHFSAREMRDHVLIEARVPKAQKAGK